MTVADPGGTATPMLEPRGVQRGQGMPSDSSWSVVRGACSTATVTTSPSSAKTTSGTGGPSRTAPSCRSPPASSRAPAPVLATSVRPPASTNHAFVAKRPHGAERSHRLRKARPPIRRAGSGRHPDTLAPMGGGPDCPDAPPPPRCRPRRHSRGERRPEHSGLVAIETAVTPLGIAVERIEFPGQAAGKRRTDSPAVCIATVGDAAVRAGRAPRCPPRPDRGGRAILRRAHVLDGGR